jgi:hypothetical protein
VKRKVSKSSLSPRRKKPKLRPSSASDAADVTGLIDGLEDQVEQLCDTVTDLKESSLTKENRQRLEVIRDRIASLLPPE